MTNQEANKIVASMTPAQTKELLNNWFEGKGTEYQRRLAVLGRHYGHENPELLEEKK